MSHDPVTNPSHYVGTGFVHQKNGCGKPIEPIDITSKLTGCRSNAVKYIVRAGLKSDGTTAIEKEVEDIRKAIFYLNYELEYLENKLKAQKELITEPRIADGTTIGYADGIAIVELPNGTITSTNPAAGDAGWTQQEDLDSRDTR